MSAELSAILRAQHRDLDRLLGALLDAIQSADLLRALDAALTFRDALNAHVEAEEEGLFPPKTERKLVPGELRVEHLQVRELASMIVRQLGEKADLPSAIALAGNLAERWRAHTEREERELYGA